MALDVYKKKRDFKKTPEPTGGRPTGKKLLFVVQKHKASHLHYDFRLELHGVLKSWAVPKGLSMDADVRRLAMEVEDHPWDYRDFEGIIPSGYGKGTVMVWDEGWYETAEEGTKPDKKSQSHSINAQYWKGAIKFTLHGKKLKGTFAIYKDKSKEDNSWYVQKINDSFATKADVTKKNKSILSGKTLEQIAADPSREWTSHSEAAEQRVEASESKGKREAFPNQVSPMNCRLIRKPFDDPDWIYELKLDGYRVVAFVNGDEVVLRSRSGLNYTGKFAAVADAFRRKGIRAVLDGEMTVTGEEGIPDFSALQNYRGEGPLLYYVFDILWKDGYRLEELDLLSRKKILKEVVPATDMIRFTDFFDQGIALFEEVKKRKLEGIVAKRKSGIYQQGIRSDDWLKLPAEKHQEFVIGGWVESDSAHPFKSLVFGAYSKNDLIYAGHSGSGFTDKQRREIIKKLQKIEIKKNPFAARPDVAGKIHFVQPDMVADFKFATWTKSGKIRKPAVFKGWREDKNPKDVMFDVPLSASEEKKIIEDELPSPAPVRDEQDTNDAVYEESNWHYILNEEITSQGSVKLNGHQVELTNVEREIWQGVPKASLIEYYNSIAPYILPHLKDRPQSLHIKNINAGAPGFYIKDMEGHQPGWADIFTVKRKHPAKGKSDLIHYFVCDDEAALIYLINLGCIDINPWTSTTKDYLHPDYIIIDLDPTDDDFQKVIKAATAAKNLLARLRIKSFPKTSGKTGIHIYIPCSGFTFPQARSIALNLCRQVHEQIPDISTIENTIAKRGTKVFLDYNQNDEADTVAAPYAVRPAKIPTVSTPLDWKEVNKKLSPANFTIYNIPDRLHEDGDKFKDVLNENIQALNNKILKKLIEL